MTRRTPRAVTNASLVGASVPTAAASEPQVWTGSMSSAVAAKAGPGACGRFDRTIAMTTMVRTMTPTVRWDRTRLRRTMPVIPVRRPRWTSPHRAGAPRCGPGGRERRRRRRAQPADDGDPQARNLDLDRPERAVADLHRDGFLGAERSMGAVGEHHRRSRAAPVLDDRRERSAGRAVQRRPGLVEQRGARDRVRRGRTPGSPCVGYADSVPRRRSV